MPLKLGEAKLPDGIYLPGNLRVTNNADGTVNVDLQIQNKPYYVRLAENADINKGWLKDSLIPGLGKGSGSGASTGTGDNAGPTETSPRSRSSFVARSVKKEPAPKPRTIVKKLNRKK